MLNDVLMHREGVMPAGQMQAIVAVILTQQARYLGPMLG